MKSYERTIKPLLILSLILTGAFSAIGEEQRHTDAKHHHETPSAGILKAYAQIQKSLSEDSLKHVVQQAKAISSAALGGKVPGLPPKVAKQAKALADAKDIKASRKAFKELSKSFEAHLKKNPDPTGKYRVAYFPMAKASWVQSGKTIANPYYGKSMLKCGTFKK